MSEQFSVSDLESYLDEALPPEAMAKIEASRRRHSIESESTGKLRVGLMCLPSQVGP